MTIPKPLQDKLKDNMFMTGGNTDAEKDFYEKAAVFGYSVAEVEIERIKGLLRVCIKNEIRYSYPLNTKNLPKLIELEWIQYKIENKL